MVKVISSNNVGSAAGVHYITQVGDLSGLKEDVSDGVGRISTYVTCAVRAMVPALGPFYFNATNFSLCSFPLPLQHLHPS